MPVRRPAGGMRVESACRGAPRGETATERQRDRGAGQPGSEREYGEHETMANSHGTASSSDPHASVVSGFSRTGVKAEE